MAEVLGSRTAPSVSRLGIPPNDQLPNDIRRLVSAHDADNWIRALSLNPETARRFVRYFEQLFSSTGQNLTLTERELIAVVVSTANGCGLCALHHTHALGEALDDIPKARRIATDLHFAQFSTREHALADLAIKITKNPRDIEQTDFDRLRGEGLSDAAILEAIETASWFTPYQPDFHFDRRRSRRQILPLTHRHRKVIL